MAKRRNTLGKAGELFYCESAMQTWEKIAEGHHKVTGYINGPFHFILLEPVPIALTTFVSVLTHRGYVLLDTYDVRDFAKKVKGT